MKRFLERRAECATDTQYIVNLSGYKWSKKQLGVVENMTILDAACGTGYGSFYLAQDALRVIGIDKDMHAIKFAKNKYRRSNLLFLQMDCAKLDFNDKTFDAVISQDTIEHIQDDEKFLSEIKRVLKHNGILIVFTPYSLTHNEKPINVYHIREYSKESLEKLIANYFSNIKFYSRRLSPELAKLEESFNKIRHYDKLEIRRIIPRSIRHLLSNLIAKIKGNITLKDLSCRHIKYFDGVEGTSTFIVLCKNEQQITG